MAVGEIPTLKTQAKLQRNKMLNELLFDYEIFHLQLKLIGRIILRPFLSCACCRSYHLNNKSQHVKPSAWLCEVHVDDELEDDQSQDSMSFIHKFFKWIVNTITEDDIQSLITTERNYAKHHRQRKTEDEKKDNDDDDE